VTSRSATADPSKRNAGRERRSGSTSQEGAPVAPRLRRSPLLWVLLAALLAIGLGATEGAGAEPAREPGPRAARLVFLYATCSLNKSYLSPYDASVDYTPSLQRFATQALTFERHHTEVAQSGNAYATLFTGTQAPRHGVLAHPGRLGEENDLIT